MSGKFLGISLFAILLVACAEPKYETVHKSEGNMVQGASTQDCQTLFRESGYCLLWGWEVMPTSSQQGSLIFKIVRPNALDGSPVPVDLDSSVELVLWMPSMGHGSSPTTIEQVDAGSYRATNVFFIMPGDWDLKFQVKREGVLEDEAVVALIF